MDISDNLFSSFQKPGKSNLLSKDLRLNFTRKVFAILSIQLAATFLMCALSMSSKRFLQFQIENTFLLGVSAATSIILLITLTCYREISRQVPMNYILLSIFTLAEAYTLSIVCAVYDPKLVATAAAMTVGITLSLTAYAMFTKDDFTMFKGSILTILGATAILGILSIFSNNEFIYLLYLAMGVVVYGIYIVYDIQMIIGGNRGSIDIDDYVFGSLMIYMDVIALFLKILKLLEALSKEKKKDN